MSALTDWPVLAIFYGLFAEEIPWAIGTLIQQKCLLEIIRSLNIYFPCSPLWCSRTLCVAVGLWFTSGKSKLWELWSHTSHCCSLICPANHHSRKAKTIHGEMLSWISWDFSGGDVKLDIVGCLRVRTTFHAPHHWESALLKIPSGNTKGLWYKRLNNTTWKEQREICSVPYGKFKMCQVVKDDILVFFIEAFRGSCNGNRWTEERIFHQVGFLCVASVVCASNDCIYVVWKGYLLCCYIQCISFFTDRKIAVTNWSEALIKTGISQS